MRLCAFSVLPKSANNFLGKGSRLMSEGAGTTLGAAAVVVKVAVVGHHGPVVPVDPCKKNVLLLHFTAFVLIF